MPNILWSQPFKCKSLLIFWGFGLSVGQSKEIQGITVGSNKLWMTLLLFLDFSKAKHLIYQLRKQSADFIDRLWTLKKVISCSSHLQRESVNVTRQLIIIIICSFALVNTTWMLDVNVIHKLETGHYCNSHMMERMWPLRKSAYQKISYTSRIKETDLLCGCKNSWSSGLITAHKP